MVRVGTGKVAREGTGKKAGKGGNWQGKAVKEGTKGEN